MVTAVTVTVLGVRKRCKEYLDCSDLFWTFAAHMTTEEIKKIVDDERAGQLTAQLCRHWKVATERLESLQQELEANMDTCVEAEVYAAMMRMQSAVMALVELNKMPDTYLFSEHLERIADSVSNASIRQSVVALVNQLLKGEGKEKSQKSFFELVSQSLAGHFALPAEKQAAIEQQISPLQHVLTICAQHLKPEDLMMVFSVIQEMSVSGDMMNQEKTAEHVQVMRETMEELADKMDASLQMMVIGLLILMLLPGLMVSLMQQKRTDSKAMAQLFNKVLARVRKSSKWWEYWQDCRKTLRVVNDNLSWKEIMNEERTKEREELGKVPGGLFAKWATDSKAFEADFLDVPLGDDTLRYFIFHLAALSEIARELDPTTKFGDEQLVRNETQQVGDAVLDAATKLHDLTTEAWFPHYEAMWQELILNEDIFARLKVTRQSPHNNLFTARFFCHLVGEMKKSAVFGSHSDNDLAEKLTDSRYVGTFRKNIQEGMGEETENIRNIFNTIFLKYKGLAHPKKQLHS